MRRTGHLSKLKSFVVAVGENRKSVRGVDEKAAGSANLMVHPMKKIPTIFERDWNGDRSRVLPIPMPDCDWVFAGEGVALRKYDGTAVDDRSTVELFKRHEVRQGKPTPEGTSGRSRTIFRLGRSWVGSLSVTAPKTSGTAACTGRLTTASQPAALRARRPEDSGNPERLASTHSSATMTRSDTATRVRSS